jgi:hypothetical protein
MHVTASGHAVNLHLRDLEQSGTKRIGNGQS